MNNIERLCSPLIMRVCELREFCRYGAEPEMERVLIEIKRIMADIKVKCDDDPALAKEYSYIEKPLVFFIDYTIKEGGFQFSNTWRDMAREYGELSGDEKFFDMLTETLDDPYSKNRLEIFYLMMGLGFDGIYKREPENIERKMKVCATRIDHVLDITKEPVTKISQTAFQKKKRKESHLFTKLILAASILLLLGSLGFNYYVFNKHTTPFQTILNNVLINSAPNLGATGTFNEEGEQQ